LANPSDPDRMNAESAQALLLQLASTLASAPAFFGPTLSAKEGAPTRTTEPPDVAARYRTLVEQIPAVIFMAFLDQGLSEAYVSPHVETVLGFTQEQWLNDPIRWYHQIHPDDRSRWSIEAAQLILSGQPLRSVYRVIARDGHVVWFHCEVKIVLAEDGRPWFIHGTAFDITNLKEAEIALQRARDDLEARVHERTSELAQANRDLQQEIAERKRAQAELARTIEELRRSSADLEQFAYSASHDLQEPLRMVSIYTQMLQRKCGGQLGANNEYLEHVVAGATRMERLLTDLRAFIQASTPDTGAAPDADACEALHQALATLTATIESSGASVTHGPLPSVRMHQFQLEQLFQNLIGNAIRYSGPETPRILVTAEQCGDQWKFSVQDNGIGIEPQYQEHIFGMFKRLHHWNSYPGTGMGLAICKRIVERAGGRIWVESQLGQGSTFSFTVPAGRTAER
jgi:PAS domain S-box-containing protein